MKKVLLAIISFGVLMGMVACSNNDNNQPNNDQQNQVNDQNINSDDAESSEDIEDNADNDQINENNNENAEEDQADDNDGNVADDQDNQIPEELADFEETPTLSEQIELNNLSPEIETDNRNNRVIIYSDDSNNKQYKSIFIKKQNRLKIISLDDDGQIFNEIIE